MGRHSPQGTTQESEQALFRILGALALLAVVLGAAWLLTRPAQEAPEPGEQGAAQLLVDSSAELPISGRFVGVVLASRVSIAEVLRRNELPLDGATAMGGPTYVIEVGGRSVSAALQGLRADPAVASAGPVFEGAAAAKPSAETTASR